MDLRSLRLYFNQGGPDAACDLVEFVNEVFDVIENHPEAEWVARLKKLLEEWKASVQAHSSWDSRW